MATDPSETELQLLKVLWAHERLSAREVHNATEKETGWSFSATRKTLDRMAAKGLVRVEPVHGIKTFVPARPKIDVMARLIKRFARRVLDTDGRLPAAAFTGSKVIQPDEIAELEALLEKLSAEDDA